MTLLFKVPPPAHSDEDIISLSARTHGLLDWRIEDRVFLWWSEAQGGAGLAGHGLLVHARQAGSLLMAEVEPITLMNCGFNRANLRPFRDATGSDPRVGLAAKLYRHALNKVVAITPAEAAFLDQRLEGG